MRRLGAILAGGEARRFGGDKGAALLNGRALIDHVADRLRDQVDAIVIAGRDWPGLERVDDAPAPGFGPLGGLCGALAFAAMRGFDLVVSHPCDLLPTPDWSVVTGEDACFAAGHFASGVWSVALSGALLAYLEAGNDRSMRGWIASCGARAIDCGVMTELNTRAAFNAYAARPTGGA